MQFNIKARKLTLVQSIDLIQISLVLLPSLISIGMCVCVCMHANVYLILCNFIMYTYYSYNHNCSHDTELFHHHKDPLCYPFMFISTALSHLFPIPNPWQSLICSPSLKFLYLRILCKWNHILFDLL